MKEFDFTRFIAAFLIGFISAVLVVESVRRVKTWLSLRKKLVEEHAASMQALRILKSRIWVSNQAGKEHVISKYEKDVINDALAGKYTTIGL